ncbi:S-layer homology domain-containing protein [Synechococcus elongatus]|uniref:S-layer homology domain-containing protein n=1 Tax=Synechococcus elongatus TaxID=32046 RepID=UPI000F7F440A|nr:S-layer homology domain-containing protein [Synechococcus elongatus]
MSQTLKAGLASLLFIGSSSSALTLTFSPAALAQSTRFSDVSSSYWAQPFVEALANRGIITGFPDGSFRPNEPVSRAQFAAMLDKAFTTGSQRSPQNFSDVPSNYWARNAIDSAYSRGFMSGYTSNRFQPEQSIPRVQALVSLGSGLNLNPRSDINGTLSIFADNSSIPDYARDRVAAATERNLVVNYPDPQFLNPNRSATRAEVAAFLYQSLASNGQVAQVDSPYIVSQNSIPVIPSADIALPPGSLIPVRYDAAERVLLAPGESIPLTLTVSQDLTRSGRVVIPRGSQINGELRPANLGNQAGTQFVARNLVLPNGQTRPLNARSEIITDVETVQRGANLGNILTGTAVGAAAAAVISGLTGDRRIDVLEVLGGAGVGGLLSGLLIKNNVDLLVVEPNRDLALTLDSEFAAR